VRLLLDTHAFLWWCGDDPRLGDVERQAIRDGANEAYLSAASVWEMAIKQALGRLQVPEPVSAAAARLGFEPLPIAFAHAEARPPSWAVGAVDAVGDAAPALDSR